MAEWKENGEEQQFDIILPLAEEAHINAIIPVDDAAFQNPASMQQAIIDYCATHQLQVPQTKAEIVRCVLQSLAAKYAEATAHLNEMLPQPIKCMHIIGRRLTEQVTQPSHLRSIGRSSHCGSYRGYGYGQHPDPGTCQGRNQGYRRAESVVRQSI